MKIEHEEILEIIETLAKSPHERLCKHYVMLEILQFLELKTGYIDKELIKTISNVDDEKILKRIQELKKSS